jgi:hypothetical protein
VEMRDRITEIIPSKKTELPALPTSLENILKIANIPKTAAKDLPTLLQMIRRFSTKSSSLNILPFMV